MMTTLFQSVPLPAITPETVLGLIGGTQAISFTTLTFLGFFAVAAILNYALPRIARPYFLLAASYLFFCWDPSDRALVPVLLGATLVTWVCGLIIGRSRNRVVRVLFLVVSILTGIGLLFYYKYWNLLADSLGGVLSHRSELFTPLGLGYFTLAALSYTIDVYKRRCRVEYNLLHYALFVSFFPTMITGPIERYPHLRPQMEKSRRFSYNRCAGGAFRMLWGYTKKMVLADNLNLYIKTVYDSVSTMSGPNLVAATLLFSVRLYLDFSGCCDIAIGAARILGYDLLENFRSPFEAVNFSDFWSRWHISLTSWLRDYLYFPLGGSRCNVVRHMLNLVIVFAVSGLWHGADWRYLQWGLACGIISVIAQLTAAPRKALARVNPLYREPAVQKFIQRCITFLLFSFTLIFFAGALYNAQPFEVMGGMLSGWDGGLSAAWQSVTALIRDSGIDGRLPVVLICGCGIVFAAEHNGNNVARWIRRQNFVLRWTLYYAACAAILFFAAFGQSAFIYQQF
ncbi:MAG: MBOAT family O-acyltransferase [Gemmiger sp.]|nr:MBOAT family O-acyltransferase [Gemmiger sp.]